MTQPHDHEPDEVEPPATAADDHLVGDGVGDGEDDDTQGHIYSGALQDKNQQP